MKNSSVRHISLSFAASLMLSAATLAAVPAAQISFKTLPDPPRSGANVVEVTVKSINGAPIKDASVEVRFFMAAMPSMSMPEMQSVFHAGHIADGVYRGQGNLVMGGSWQVTVTVTRNGARLGRKSFSVAAK